MVRWKIRLLIHFIKKRGRGRKMKKEMGEGNGGERKKEGMEKGKKRKHVKKR